MPGAVARGKLITQSLDLQRTWQQDKRDLYSLRHTYATLEFMEDGTYLHTLAKQMGASAGMIEKHYSKLTATIAADKLN